MATTEPVESRTLPQQYFSPLAGLLSYLVPGLGQVVQGRIGKGLLFFFSLYFLFFFGQYLGEWRNVYINDASRPAQNASGRGRLFETVVDKARFFSQFWIGVAAWPAIVQHLTYTDEETAKLKLRQEPGREPTKEEVQNAVKHPWFGTYQRRPSEEELNNLLRNSDKSPDLGWMYTVIAGVLNILVIYDALAGPAYVVTAARAPVSAGPKETALGPTG